MQSEERDAQQIDDDKRKIKPVKSHCGRAIIADRRDFSNSSETPLVPSAIMPAVAYFLGIDGGGSNTTCVLGDEKRVLGSVTVGGSNIVRFGQSTAGTVLQQGVREVCRKAAIKPRQIVAICAGIAGAAREDIRKQVTGILAKLVPAHIEVLGDMVIAHEAALGSGAGI